MRWPVSNVVLELSQNPVAENTDVSLAKAICVSGKPIRGLDGQYQRLRCTYVAGFSNCFPETLTLADVVRGEGNLLVKTNLISDV